MTHTHTHTPYCHVASVPTVKFKGKSFPVQAYNRPEGFQKVEATVVSALRTGHLYPPKELFPLLISVGDRGSTVVKVLCYKSEGRWFDSRSCHSNFTLIYSFRSHYGPGVDSASNRNQCQQYFLGVKAVGA